MIFEWDEEKNSINKVKHRISFETAAHVLMIRIILRCMILNIVRKRTAI